MDKCELCAEGIVTHSDDYVRVVIDERDYGRPMYLCPKCLQRIKRCYLCRWYDEGNRRCLEGPFIVKKNTKDRCGRWKQDAPVIVEETPKEEVKRGCPKFVLV